MRCILGIIALVFVLTGCSKQNDCFDSAFDLRERIANSNGCVFELEITTDYQDGYYTFQMSCESDVSGNIKFTVTSPESICGITGVITAEDGKLTFDDKLLLFSLLADGEITPVSAPWFFIKALRGGYIAGCSIQDNGTLLQIDDSYADKLIKQNIYLSDGKPLTAEIIWEGRRIVTLDVKDFQIL